MKKLLLEKIEGYLNIQERKEAISLSLNINNDLRDIIEMVKNSQDRDKTLSMFSDEIREQIKKLIDGGII